MAPGDHPEAGGRPGPATPRPVRRGPPPRPPRRHHAAEVAKEESPALSVIARKR